MKYNKIKDQTKDFYTYRWVDESPKRNDTKRWQINPLSENMAETNPMIEGREFRYGKTGGFMLKDGGLAKALQQKYGKRNLDVWEVKDQWDTRDKGHKYTHKGSALPWHKECRQCGRKAEGELCQECVERLEVAETAEKKG